MRRFDVTLFVGDAVVIGTAGDGRAWISDTGGTTEINGVRVEAGEKKALRDDDVIKIGDSVVVRVQVEPRPV
ncbi:hypothetical protein [Dactylosporangium sp. CS-033363]|uniref:hypothetical protein n=1 Tax=Dactylosporangium sp. CS-033363 TaxID=3239935 RepID=UPI003D8B1A0C